MTVLEKILDWSSQLPAWQGDALRRLFHSRKLSDDDYDDLVALALSCSGVPDEKDRVPHPLAKEHLPASPPAGIATKLRSVGPLRGVNALATGQTLTFGDSGLTVIYGHNGAGKSGYARVLKTACRARDEEPVLPNAELLPSEQVVPEADFGIAINGNATQVTWSAGSPPPDSLSNLSVFDARCARVYLDDESDIAYKPYGLDLIEDLAVVCDEVKRRLRDRASRLPADLSAFDDLKEATTIGRLLSTLFVGTDVAVIEDL